MPLSGEEEGAARLVVDGRGDYGEDEASFFGDLHATGRDGVEFYTERKVVISR